MSQKDNNREDYFLQPEDRLRGKQIILVAYIPDQPEFENGSQKAIESTNRISETEEAIIAVSEAVSDANGNLLVIGDAASTALAVASFGNARSSQIYDPETGFSEANITAKVDSPKDENEIKELEDLETLGLLNFQRTDTEINWSNLISNKDTVAIIGAGDDQRTLERLQGARSGGVKLRIFSLSSITNIDGIESMNSIVDKGEVSSGIEYLTETYERTTTDDLQSDIDGTPSENSAFGQPRPFVRLWNVGEQPYAFAAQEIIDMITNRSDQ